MCICLIMVSFHDPLSVLVSSIGSTCACVFCLKLYLVPVGHVAKTGLNIHVCVFSANCNPAQSNVHASLQPDTQTCSLLGYHIHDKIADISTLYKVVKGHHCRTVQILHWGYIYHSNRCKECTPKLTVAMNMAGQLLLQSLI